VDGGRHDVVRYLVEKKAETNWIVPSSVLWMFRLQVETTGEVEGVVLHPWYFFQGGGTASLSICEDIAEFI